MLFSPRKNNLASLASFISSLLDVGCLFLCLSTPPDPRTGRYRDLWLLNLRPLIAAPRQQQLDRIAASSPPHMHLALRAFSAVTGAAIPQWLPASIENSIHLLLFISIFQVVFEPPSLVAGARYPLAIGTPKHPTSHPVPAQQALCQPTLNPSFGQSSQGTAVTPHQKRPAAFPIPGYFLSICISHHYHLTFPPDFLLPPFFSSRCPRLASLNLSLPSTTHYPRTMPRDASPSPPPLPPAPPNSPVQR